MHTAAGLTILQGLAATVSGAITHYSFNNVSIRLGILMGTAIFISAFIGAAVSIYLSNEVMLFIFAGLAMTASFLMILSKEELNGKTDPKKLSFSKWRAVASAVTVGILGGLVGQGGSFILIPLMIYFVNIPARIAIGSNLMIVLFSSLAGSIGKAATGQVEWLMAVPIVVTVIPAAYIGGRVSRKTPVTLLKRLLALLIGASAIKICWSIFSAG